MNWQKTYQLLVSDKKKGTEILYNRYGKQLFNYTNKNWQLDEDSNWEVVYKSLYKVVEKIENSSFQSEKKFTSFLFKIHLNFLKNHVRDIASKGYVKSEELTETMDYYNEAVSPNSSNVNTIIKELDELEDWKRVLLLLRSQGMAYEEIGNYVDKPVNQLKVYYGRLKKELAQKLESKIKIEANEKV